MGPLGTEADLEVFLGLSRIGECLGEHSGVDFLSAKKIDQIEITAGALC